MIFLCIMMVLGTIAQAQNAFFRQHGNGYRNTGNRYNNPNTNHYFNTGFNANVSVGLNSNFTGYGNNYGYYPQSYGYYNQSYNQQPVYYYVDDYYDPYQQTYCQRQFQWQPNQTILVGLYAVPDSPGHYCHRNPYRRSY